MQQWWLALTTILTGPIGYFLKRWVERRARSEALKRRLQALSLLQAMRREHVSMKDLRQIEQEASESNGDHSIGVRAVRRFYQDQAREDFSFLRRFRLRWDGASTKIGNAVLAAGILIAGGIIATGFWAWINSGGRPP